MLFDSHAHLNNDTYTDEQREALIKEIEASDLSYVMDVGFDLESSLRAVKHAAAIPWCYAVVGVHPHDAKTMDEDVLTLIKGLTKKEKVQAIGEIGLDFHYNHSDQETQEYWFRRQIQLANELKMPIVIHSREADQKTLDILKEEGAFSDTRYNCFPKRVGPGGVLEKDLALSIAFEVGKELEKSGYAVVYTRTDDRLLYEPEQNVKGIRKISDLKNRCAVAALYPESLLVSIHMNSFAQEKYSGLQVYYSDNDELSRSVAVSVQNRVKADIQPNNNRAVKQGKGIYILENSSNPSILIECGFLSNKSECEKLLQKEYQKQLSFSIVCGIIEVLE